MNEHQPIDPSAAAGAVDPTHAEGNKEHTLALLDPEQRYAIAVRMDPQNNPVGANETAPMRLAPGTSLEAQCNKNYAYLNQERITMDQLVGAMEDVRATAIHAEAAGSPSELSYDRTISAFNINPVTGEADSGQETFVRSRGQEVQLIFGDNEIEAAKFGVFGAPQTYQHPASLRAEQIISGLRDNEAGRAILAARGIDQPDQPSQEPIALLEEPTGPTPGEQALQTAEATERGAVEAAAEQATALVERIVAELPQNYGSRTKVRAPVKGKRLQVGIPETVVQHQMLLEATDFKGQQPVEYKITLGNSRGFSDGSRNMVIRWTPGEVPVTEQLVDIPNSDPRNWRDGVRTEFRKETVSSTRLADVNESLEAFAQEKLPTHNGARQQRVGRGILSLFGKR